MNIVAIDPGNTCGLAEYLSEYESVFFRSWQREPFETAVYVAYLLEGLEVDVVACESFVPRPGVRSWQPDALETIGALRYICRRYDVPLELQSPADAKRFSTNDKLAVMGWRNPTPGGHADDAARHLLLAAVRHGAVDPDRFLT